MTKSGCRFEEQRSYAHRQVDDQPGKSHKNDDKSAVVMLKHNDWHENVRQPVVNRDRSHGGSGRPDINRDTCHELECTTIGLCFPRHEAAEVYLTEELRHAESNPTREIHVSYCTSHENSRPKFFDRIYLPISAALTLQNLRIVHRRRQSGKSKVPAKQRGSWPKMCGIEGA